MDYTFKHEIPQLGAIVKSFLLFNHASFHLQNYAIFLCSFYESSTSALAASLCPRTFLLQQSVRLTRQPAATALKLRRFRELLSLLQLFFNLLHDILFTAAQKKRTECHKKSHLCEHWAVKNSATVMVRQKCVTFLVSAKPKPRRHADGSKF